MKLVTCPVCGKSFIRAPANIFKATIDGKVKHLCGWNCLRAVEMEKEAKKKCEEG